MKQKNPGYSNMMTEQAMASANNGVGNSYVNFKALLSHAHSAFIVTQANGMVVEANTAASQMFGYSRDELVNIALDKIICDDGTNQHELQLDYESNNGSRLMKTGTKKNGEKFLLEITSAIISDEHGTSSLFSLLYELSAQNELHQEMSLLMNNTQESFILLNKELNIITYNAKAYQVYLDFMASPLKKGISIFNFAAPERIPLLRELYKKILGGETQAMPMKMVSKSGEEKIFNLKYAPARDEDGHIIGVFITANDITNEQQQLAALEAAEAKLKKIMDSSPDVICTTDEHGHFVKLNAAAERVWGYPIEELSGKAHINIVVPEDQQKTKDAHARIISGINLANFENRCIARNGDIFNMEWSAKWDEADRMIYWVARDVTEKKHAEFKLKQREQRFKSLVQDGSDLIGILDREANYKYVSPTSFSVLGYTPEEFITRNAFDFIHPDDRERVMENFKSLSAQMKLSISPFRFKHKNGEWRWIETTVTNLENEPAVQGFVTNSRDITDRILAHKSLKFSARLMDTIGQAVISTDTAGTINYWNHMAETIYGYSKEEAFGKNIKELILTAQPTNDDQASMLKLQNDQTWSGEFLAKRKNGEQFSAWITNAPVFDEHQKMIGIIGVSSDISERKKIEESLRLNNERFNLVEQATSDVIWDWDLQNGTVLRSARNMEKLFGYKNIAEFNTAAFWTEKVHPEDRARIDLQSFFNDPSQIYLNYEYRFRTAAGTYAFVHDKGYVIRNKAGKPIRMIGAVTDITNLKKNEIELQKINNALVQQAKVLAFSNQQLEQFAYVASHDLQEPLRMITSFLTQIEKKYEPLLDEKGKRYIYYAVDGARRMRQIILDLLEYSRAGNEQDQLEEVNLDELLVEIQGLLRKKITEKKAVITVTKLPLITAHISPMRQVFQNLLTNALLYSRDGEALKIRVSVKEEPGHWVFAVADNGIGIRQDYFDKIFIIFQRLHAKSDYPGTGVGLAISKKIIEYYGGKIWLESTEGVGSTFYFSLPEKTAERII